MKKLLSKSLMLMLAALAVGMVSSCSNDDESSSSYKIKPVKSPDFVMYSGKTVLKSTFGNVGTRATVNVDYFKIQDFGGGKSEWMHSTYPVLYQYFDNAPAKTDRDEQVSTDEYNYVMNYIKTHPDEGGKECTLTTYFIQNAGSSDDTYELAFMNGDAVHHTQNAVGGNHMDYFMLNGDHVNDYNAHNGPRALCVDIPVVNPTYHETYGTEENTKTDAYKFYYIEYNGKTACYLCFDYRMKKYDNGMCDFKGDGVYNDWVIKLIPADGSDAVAPTDPVIDPIILPTETGGEVEINLSVNDKKDEGDYIATKLSLHVRDTTDVEVFIPVPAEFYCDADDMNIVLTHEVEMAYGSTPVTYNVEGTVVTATVTFENGGIRVTTQGITADVLKYLRTTYGDGITFEVWNYFNDSITRETLKPYLDKSTVTFITDTKRYVNAFAIVDGAVNPWDCKVVPTSDAYGAPEKGWGYNNSEFNDIYNL